MCPAGFFGAGCTTPTSTITVDERAFDLMEPSESEVELRTILIPLVRTPSTVNATAIEAVVLTGGTAKMGTDYDIVSMNNITWTSVTAGHLTLQLNVFHDIIYEPTENFFLRVQPHASLYQDCTLSGPLVLTFTIRDGAPGKAFFSRSSLLVSEDEPAALVMLERVGGSVGTMSAVIVPANSTTAQGGLDYTFVRCGYTFAPETMLTPHI